MPDDPAGVTIGKEEAAARAKAEATAKDNADILDKLRNEATAAALKVADANSSEIKALSSRFDTVLADLKSAPLSGMKVLDDMRDDVKGLLITLKDEQHKTLEAALTHHKENNTVKASNRSVGVFLNWYDADLSKLWDWFLK